MDVIEATVQFQRAELEKILENIASVRYASMVQKYGEVCTKTTAGKILSCSLQTINAMLKDGRLKEACVGRRVDVRSIANYIEKSSGQRLPQRRNKRGNCQYV